MQKEWREPLTAKGGTAVSQSTTGYTSTTPRKNANDLDLMLDTKTVAELGGWSRRHVLNMLNSGQLKGVRLGASWRVGRDYFLHDVLGLEA